MAILIVLKQICKGKNELVSRGCIKKLIVETIAYVFTDISLLVSHSPLFFKK